MSIPPNSRPGASRAQIVLAFAAVYVIWGSTYLTIHIAIETIPALLMSGARFILAGLLLLAFSHRPGAPRERLTLIHWRSALVIGGCLLLFGNGGVAWGEQYLPSGFVALIIATVPLWMALFAPAFGGRWINWTAAVGIALGLVGIALLVKPGGGGAGHWQTLVVLMAPLLWALGSLYARNAPAPRQSLTAVAMEMIAGGVLLSIAGAAGGELGHVHLGNVSVASVAAFVYLVLIGSLVGYVAYIWLLHHVSVTAASTYAFVNPVVAVALGAIVLGEQVTLLTVVAAAFIIGAVVLLLIGQSRATEPAATVRMPVRDVA
ncbi:MAG TPA: EamA family transporter [Candidatus Saccharimonadales bacterium]|nr:EamA family transporter [Candidatus Saccharimonadales bacterium]